MSFMFNPHPYDDPAAINRPYLSEDVIHSIISGTMESAIHLADVVLKKLESDGKSIIIAIDGYIGTQFEQMVNLITRHLRLNSYDVQILDIKNVFKPSQQLEDELLEYLKEDRKKDPVLLFGKLFKGGYEELVDADKLENLATLLCTIKSNNSKDVYIVYGCGSAIRKLRTYYDIICYFDVTPKEVILRARKGMFVNLGDQIAKPVKALLRRCYYIDFEVAGHLRWDLIKSDLIDYYILSNDPDNLKMIPRETFSSITSSLVTYPLRCKPVYLEGVWGGYYFKRLRNLPDTMRNCAWVFDLIPLEVSIVVEAGSHLLEFPFFTFVQKEGIALMGASCVNEFGGYFPIRFNYDDSYHSSGNMSIQVHSGHKYNIENFNEHGRQDESYYVVAAGHGAKTYIGFNEGIDADEFISEVKKSEKEFTPVDYRKYVNHIQSFPGMQFLLPSGTIHSSGRNQVVLEIGSLTVGSYTYKMYDYLRADIDGIPRPIHTYHGEKVLCKERTAGWVKENLVQKPQLVRKGEGWAEYIIGEHDLLYFSLRRLEFEESILDDTAGKFHVLNLVDGEKVIIQSLTYPDLCYTQHYLDVVIVPANIGKYIINNMGNQPVCIHKTMLKDDFVNKCLPDS